jgi:hypothetical protein
VLLTKPKDDPTADLDMFLGKTGFALLLRT